MLHKFDHRQNDIFTIEYVRIDHKWYLLPFFFASLIAQLWACPKPMFFGKCLRTIHLLRWHKFCTTMQGELSIMYITFSLAYKSSDLTTRSISSTGCLYTTTEKVTRYKLLSDDIICFWLNCSPTFTTSGGANGVAVIERDHFIDSSQYTTWQYCRTQLTRFWYRTC